MKKSNLLVLLPIVALASCGGDSISSSSSLNSYVTYSDEIKSIDPLGPVTGPKSKSRTDQMTVGGCDLGYPLFDSETKKSYNFFGDTFDTPNQSGRWRSNTISVSADQNLADGLDIDSFISSKSGIAIPAIEGHHADKYEMTKIPTGVFDLNGVFYMFYFSKYSWNVPSPTSMNYGGTVKSLDKGQTWERVYDLTWTDHAVDDATKQQARVSDIQTLINEDVDMNKGVGNIDVAEHLGYRFTEITPYEAKDGYVYLFGQGGYRSSWISLARVAIANFETFSEYQYLTGYNAKNEPIWVKGRDGLNYLGSHPEEGYCLEVTGTEMTFMYSTALKRYMIFMASNSSGPWGAHYFTSETIGGPYNVHGTMVLPSSSPLLPQTSLYAPMVNEAWTEDNGYVFYMLISTWMPDYNPNLFRVEFN